MSKGLSSFLAALLLMSACTWSAAQPPAESGAAAVQTIPQLVRQMQDSIVRISVLGAVESIDGSPNVKPDGKLLVGTGFVIDNAGHIVTNAHVAQPGLPGNLRWKEQPRFSVELLKWSNHPQFRGRPAFFLSKQEEQSYAQISFVNEKALVTPRLVGADQLSDLAVLKIPPELLPALKFAKADSVKVGEDVIAIGFARPLEISGSPSSTKGIVSAQGRSMTNEHGLILGDLIQTNAAINHGNSGGPLLNMRGEVVGVNTLTMAGASDPSIQGIYFARSCRTAELIVARLIKEGRIERPNLGIKPDWIGFTEGISSNLPEGVLIKTVEPGSPAAEAKLEPGYLITRVGEYAVHSPGDLNDALALLKRGQKVEVAYRDYRLKAPTGPKGDTEEDRKRAWLLYALKKAEGEGHTHIVTLTLK